jgi:F-type H+-transporting ATPase subunit b
VRIHLIERLRRWFLSRPRRFLLAGALGSATFLLATAGSAQNAPVPAAPPAAPAETPAAPAEQAHEATHGEEGGHGPGAAHSGEAAHGGEHAVHHPEAFNFADTARFQKEKDQAAKGEKDEHGKVPTPVTPYAYLLINAAILFFIYYSAGKKPIAAGLAARRATVAKELDEAAKIKGEAQARLDEYTKRLDELDHELARIKKELVTAGEADRDRMVKEAEEKADRMRKDAQFLLDQEIKQLRNDLLRHTVDVATAAAEAVLRSRVSAQDHERLAEEYLKQVTALPPAGAPGTVSAEKKGGAS